MTDKKQRFYERLSRLEQVCERLDADPLLKAHVERQMRFDINASDRVKHLSKRYFAFRAVRHWWSSGFPMASLLRYYLEEFNIRLTRHGPGTLPTSFNVVGAFMDVNEELSVFDLFDEREHLLDLVDYIDWYTGGTPLASDIRILTAAMQENTPYSYNFADPIAFTLTQGPSQIIILGISLVRVGTDLSLIVLAGESPPEIPDDAVPTLDIRVVEPRKQKLFSRPFLPIRDRYLKSYPQHARTIMLATLNLPSATFGTRYVMRDLGPHYDVVSDDRRIFPADASPLIVDKHVSAGRDEILRYDGLFSAALSLAYLPIMFVERASSVHETRFVTELQLRRREQRVQEAIGELGLTRTFFDRAVACLPKATAPRRARPSMTVQPPEMSFAVTGYWKALGPGEIGQDAKGRKILGKTWVERSESWAASSPESFLASISPSDQPRGNDPGCIYVMRSGSHYADIYKIGLTRREPRHRAHELDVTGVPLPFDVLARWDVADCAEAKKLVHERLKSFRVRSKREFFRADLGHIISVIQTVLHHASVGNAPERP